jgi:hypothetical protein
MLLAQFSADVSAVFRMQMLVQFSTDVHVVFHGYYCGIPQISARDSADDSVVICN